MRLKILESLFTGPLSVGEIVADVGAAQANVSKHLALLHAVGLVARRKDGTRILYSLADPMIRRICGIVCQAVERDTREQFRRLASRG